MNPLALYAPSALPILPVAIGSLDGLNLDTSALKPREPGLNGERAIAQFRNRFAPEKLPFRRHYWLKPAKGGYTVMYAWHMKRPQTDIPVGRVEGDDLAAIRLVIGNQLANHLMTPIRWELYEDRDGEELISMGRFDAWSLLQNVNPADIERLAAKGLAPDLAHWDFDQIFWERRCPGCGANMSINSQAFNIDSARCATCGKRPFLTGLVRDCLKLALPGATDGGEALVASTETMFHIVEYLGGLDASITDVAGSLPDGLTPHQALNRLYAKSSMDPCPRDERALMHLESRLSDCDPATRMTAQGARMLLKQGIERGSFSEADAAAVNLLRTLLRQKKQSGGE